MKIIPTTYTFDASAKTIDCADFTRIEIIYLITNVKTGDIIYQFNNASKGGTLAGTVLTLVFDTTSMSDTDELQIVLQDPITQGDILGRLSDIEGVAIDIRTYEQSNNIILGDVYQPGNTPVQEDSNALVVASRPAKVDRIGFTKAISGGVDTSWGSIVGSIGTGMGVNQTGGNLVITAGTTARSETIIRSTDSFLGGIRLRARTTLSQRVANNNFIIELVDVVGDGLAYTINSATSITVTFPESFGLSTENVGQSMNLGLFSGTGTFFGGRYPIASVSGNNATFTVSGFAVGTGTCSVFGWNFYRLTYDGTTATQAKFDTGRNGYATGDTTATISTTASPGHLAIITGNDLVATLADQLVASSATIKQTIRASRDENVPDDVPLRLQIRVLNGTTAPTATTWTIGMVSVTNYSPQSVNIQDIRPMGTGSALPVEIMRGVALATQPVSGTVTATVAGATLAIPTTVADVASTAITTTTTTASITPAMGQSFTINMPVTVVTGTTPTLDLSIEESDDTGTNWRRIYDFERITAVGYLSSPPIKLQGNRIRYVQTLGGTTPSFTRAINRLQRNDDTKALRQRIDRTIAVNTLNSTSAVLETAGARNAQIVVNMGAITTTAPQFRIQGSEDNVNWFFIDTTALTSVANSAVQSTVLNINTKFIRAIVSTAGVGATLGYLLIKSFD